jgi:RimJ/RimL family protein N-acetyltransferase
MSSQQAHVRGYGWRDTPSAPVDGQRSDGPMDPAQQADTAETEAPLAYDPRQSGWVAARVEDDLTQPAARAHRREVQLRRWTDSDRAAFRGLLDDPEVWRTLPEPYPDPLTDDLAAALIEVSNAAPHHMVRAIVHAGAPVGQVRLEFTGAQDPSAEAELSYWIGRAHWRRGLARAAIAQLLAQTPPRPLRARVLPENTASRRLLERAGFAAAGTDSRDPRWLVYRRR